MYHMVFYILWSITSLFPITVIRPRFVFTPDLGSETLNNPLIDQLHKFWPPSAWFCYFKLISFLAYEPFKRCSR